MEQRRLFSVHPLLLFLSLFLFANCTKNIETESKNIQDPTEETSTIEGYSYKGKPLRVGVVGLVHTHVHWILGRENIGDIEIVGIVEPNRDLALRYSEQHGFSMDIVFGTILEMVEATKPEAVTVFTTIFDHLAVVEFCAPRGIHVMVEKPLAVNLEHAEKMILLAEKYNIQLLTNYETSWYGSNSEAYKLVNQGTIGEVRRVVFHTGHPGPVEIGVNDEFLEWLTDPILNGGGALTDFGCYGANLTTWMMKGKPPETVTCITQRIKPDLYPKVEDEATIVLTYPNAQVIIMASWNWSHNRKDMEIYGKTGFIFCKNSTDMELMKEEGKGIEYIKADPLPSGMQDPFSFLNNVVNKNYKIPPFDPSSIENNKMVMQILEAAKQSAASGKTVVWKEMYK